MLNFRAFSLCFLFCFCFLFLLHGCGNSGQGSHRVVPVDNPNNGQSVAVEDRLVTAEGHAITRSAGYFLNNDEDSGSRRIISITQPPNGSVIWQNDHLLTYIPRHDFSGEDHFSYTSESSNGERSSADVKVSVVAMDTGPRLNSPALVHYFIGDPVSLVLRTGDAQGDHVALKVTKLPLGLQFDESSQTIQGTIRDGAGLYTTEVSVADNYQTRHTAMVWLIAEPGHENPQLAPDALNVVHEKHFPLSTWLPFSPGDEPFLTLLNYNQPRHGRLRLEADGMLTYTADADFLGTDSSKIWVTDGDGGMTEAEVLFNVTSHDMPPKLINPVLVIGHAGESLRYKIPVIEDGSPNTTWSAEHLPMGLSIDSRGIVTGKPKAGRYPVDIRASTQGGESTVTFSWVITGDASSVLAQNDAFSVDEDQVLTMTVADWLNNDSGTALTLAAVSVPLHGTLVQKDNELTYVPDQHYYGSDRMYYAVSNDQGDMATAVVTVSVKPVNDAPEIYAGLSMRVVNHGDEVRWKLFANDVENDAVSFNSDHLPPGLALSDDGVISGVVSKYAHGTDAAEINVSDGESSRLYFLAVRLADGFVKKPDITSKFVGVEPSAVELDWGTATLAHSYDVYWSTTPGFENTRINHISGNESYWLHQGLEPRMTFYYRVAADNPGKDWISDMTTATARRIPLSRITPTIADSRLLACIKEIILDVTFTDEVNKDLNCSNRQIRDIEGLQWFSELSSIDISGNKLTNLDAFAKRANAKLTALNAKENSLYSIAGVERLHALQKLDVGHNNLYDVTPLAGINNLHTLNISENFIFPHTQENLENGVTYYFAVSSVDANGLESDLSREVPVTPGPRQAGAPKAYAYQYLTTADVYWTPVPEADEYHLYYAPGPDVLNHPEIKMVTKSVYAGNHSLINLFENVIDYHFVVKTVIDGVETASSAEVGYIYDRRQFNRPTFLYAVPDDGRIHLNWVPAPGAMSYRIYWSQTPGVTKDSPQVASPANSFLPVASHTQLSELRANARNFNVSPRLKSLMGLPRLKKLALLDIGYHDLQHLNGFGGLPLQSLLVDNNQLFDLSGLLEKKLEKLLLLSLVTNDETLPCAQQDAVLALYTGIDIRNSVCLH